MSRHPDPATLELLVAGRLDSSQTETLLDHVSECESCLDRADAAWGGIEALASSLEVPAIGRRRSARIELELLRKVRVADLGSQISWFATEGFLSVVVILLRPLVGSSVSDSGGESK